LATEHICITLSNKQFDYMAAGLPLIASDVPPMRRIVDETSSGVLVPPGDSAALGQAIVDLLQDTDRCKELGNCGKRAVATRYHWPVDGRRFVRAIESCRTSGDYAVTG
jgi:glycosyltransferase involved in cell wall biosynthesis